MFFNIRGLISLFYYPKTKVVRPQHNNKRYPISHTSNHRPTPTAVSTVGRTKKREKKRINIIVTWKHNAIIIIY